jgi:hypothetical protein
VISGTLNAAGSYPMFVSREQSISQLKFKISKTIRYVRATVLGHGDIPKSTRPKIFSILVRGNKVPDGIEGTLRNERMEKE